MNDTPSSALWALDRLVGTWAVSGGATGTVTGSSPMTARWFRIATRRATNPAEQRHLMGRAARLGG